MKKLDESKIIYIDQNDHVQRVIDNQPKELNSFELIFTFKDGFHQFPKGMEFSDFNHGNIYIQGNIFFPYEDKNKVVLSGTSPIVKIENCMANIFIRYLDFKVFGKLDIDSVVYVDGTRDLDVKRNTFMAKGNDGIRLQRGRHRVWKNNFNQCKTAIDIGVGSSVMSCFNKSIEVQYSYSNNGGELNIMEGDEICGTEGRFLSKNGKIREFRRRT